MTWPYVTLPMFEVHGQHARAQSGVEVVAFAPLVLESQRDDWLDYTLYHQDWIEQSREVARGKQQQQQTGDNGDSREFVVQDDEVDDTISTDLYRAGVTSDSNGPHFPIWQFSPPPFSAKIVNWNIKDAPWMDMILPAISVSKGK